MEENESKKRILKREDILNLPNAHDIKKTIKVKGLGDIIISHASLNNLNTSFKEYPEDSKGFTLSLIFATIHDKKFKKENFTDKQIEELGKKWLEYNGYSMDFEEIVSDKKNVNLDFYQMFKLVFDNRLKIIKETFKPISEKINLSNKNLLNSLAKTFKIPQLDFVSKDVQMNFGNIVDQYISKINKAIKPKLPDLTRGLSETLKSSEEVANLHNEIQYSDLVKKLVSVTPPPNPRWEIVRSVNKMENSITDSLKAINKVQEVFVQAIEEQGEQSKENIRLQTQIKNLTVWLVVLTIGIALLTVYLIIKKP